MARNLRQQKNFASPGAKPCPTFAGASDGLPPERAVEGAVFDSFGDVIGSAGFRALRGEQFCAQMTDEG